MLGNVSSLFMSAHAIITKSIPTQNASCQMLVSDMEAAYVIVPIRLVNMHTVSTVASKRPWMLLQ